MASPALARIFSEQRSFPVLPQEMEAPPLNGDPVPTRPPTAPSCARTTPWHLLPGVRGAAGAVVPREPPKCDHHLTTAVLPCLPPSTPKPEPCVNPDQPRPGEEHAPAPAPGPAPLPASTRLQVEVPRQRVRQAPAKPRPTGNARAATASANEGGFEQQRRPDDQSRWQGTSPFPAHPDPVW